MLKGNIKNSYLTAYKTVKNLVENDENIEKRLKFQKSWQLLTEMEKSR